MPGAAGVFRHSRRVEGGVSETAYGVPERRGVAFRGVRQAFGAIRGALREGVLR